MTITYHLKCMTFSFWKEYNFDEDRTTCNKLPWLLFVPYVGTLPLASSWNSTSSFHVNLLLMACSITSPYHIVLWLLQLHLFFTKGLGLYFILLNKCKDMQIQLPCSIRIILRGTMYIPEYPLGTG